VRARNPIIVLGPDGKPLAGAHVETKLRPSGAAATVYKAETGAEAGANPATTDVHGKVVQWLERGAYESVISAAGMETYAEPWDAVPGGDHVVDTPFLAVVLQQNINKERGTVLPATPFDGQEYDFVADATNGVIWRLRYRAASTSAHKWEYVGGGELSAFVTEIQPVTFTTAEAWQALTKSPSITLPLAGDYTVNLSATTIQQQLTGQQNFNLSVARSPLTPIGFTLAQVGVAQYNANPLNLHQRVNEMPAAAVLILIAFGNNTAANSWQLGRLTLAASPIRVG
jgi:hypothetical protein